MKQYTLIFFLGMAGLWGPPTMGHAQQQVGNEVQKNCQVSVAKYKGNRTCAISYTFDDGLAQQYTIAAPELEKRGFRGTFGINGIRINQDAQHLADTTRMTWGQVKELCNRGHEISNHGWAHKNFGRNAEEAIREDIEKNDSAILAITGHFPLTFLYPNNNKQEPGRSIAQKGRVGTRLYQRSIGSKANRKYLQEWVDGLLANREYGVGMTHGIHYGYDAFHDFPSFLEHLDRVKALDNQIWVGTLCEVCAYIAERDALQLQVEQKKKHLLITPQLTLDEKLYNQPLTMVLQGEAFERITARQGKRKLPVTLTDSTAVFDFNPYQGPIQVRIK